MKKSCAFLLRSNCKKGGGQSNNPLHKAPEGKRGMGWGATVSNQSSYKHASISRKPLHPKGQRRRKWVRGGQNIWTAAFARSRLKSPSVNKFRKFQVLSHQFLLPPTPSKCKRFGWRGRGPKMKEEEKWLMRPLSVRLRFIPQILRQEKKKRKEKKKLSNRLIAAINLGKNWEPECYLGRCSFWALSQLKLAIACSLLSFNGHVTNWKERRRVGLA